MSWNPEVTTIKKVEKHPNADALDLVTIYEDIIAISKIGQYKPGDLVSYLPIDTIPGDHEIFEFLGNDRNKRIKAKRLRGIFSMGLLVPAPENFKDGDSVIDYYKLTRYFSDFEKSEYIHKDGAVLGLDSGCNEKNPKEFEIPYYDIENARKYANLFGWEEEVVISEKIHGCLAGNVKISTFEYGDIEIEKLVNEKPDILHIKSFNVFENKIEFQKCENYFNNGISEDWFEIETESGERVKLTGNHLIWVENEKKYKMVADLNGDEVIIID